MCKVFLKYGLHEKQFANFKPKYVSDIANEICEDTGVSCSSCHEEIVLSWFGTVSRSGPGRKHLRGEHQHNPSLVGCSMQSSFTNSDLPSGLTGALGSSNSDTDWDSTSCRQRLIAKQTKT